MLDFPPWKIAVIVFTLLAGCIFAAPNLLTQQQLAALPDWLPKRQMNLGLDLQGGSHILLEVDTASVIRQQLDTHMEAMQAELRDGRDAAGKRLQYEGMEAGADNTISFRVRDPGQLDQIVELMRTLSQPVGGGLLGGGLTGERDYDVSVVDGVRVLVRLTEAGVKARTIQTVNQSIEIVRRRVDELGTKEPNITRQGDDRIVVQVPGLQNPQQLKAILGQTAKLEFKMVDVSITAEDLSRGRAPPGSKIVPHAEAGQAPVVVRNRVLLTGEQLVDAQPNTQDGQWVVSFRFDSVGGKRFARITTENVGRPFAILLDGKVISAPNIRTPILGGSGIIEGGFTAESATNLAVLLRAGALPAPLTIVEERTVGPDLGADSVAAGEIAGLIGTVAVVGFMLVTYGRFGVYANISLLFNVILIVAIMSMTRSTLTLPGIAGLVLTVGTAVDANVLVFERIREELRNGRTPFNAVDAGYKEANRTIWDANITNLIAAGLMFLLGAGPIKGFAVTLSIGIFTSVFTAVVVTRLMTVLWMRSARPSKLVL